MPDMQVLPPQRVPPDVATALARRWFRSGRTEVSPLEGGGFSGSPLFRVAALGETHVLKAFAPGTSAGRVRFVHAAVRHLRSCGVNVVPAVRTADDGETFVGDPSGSWWEMQAFVAGESTSHPSPAQVVAALGAVARLHHAAASLAENPPDLAPSPGIVRRIEQARGMAEQPWTRLVQRDDVDVSLTRLIRPLLDRATAALASEGGEQVVSGVATLEPVVLPRQTVLRDLWAPHVLYEHRSTDRVVGIVDCHAMGLDTPATDLARLLGSWAVEDGFTTVAGWDDALDAYAAIRGLAPAERRLVPFLASSGVVFGLDNWFRWIFEQGRHFSNHPAVASRVERLVAALPAALAMLRNTLTVVRV